MNYDKETDYSINTGVIFTKISDSKNWEKFKREFLINEVQTALMFIPMKVSHYSAQSEPVVF